MKKKNSAYPAILYGFMGPSLSLLVRSFTDFELLEYRDIWITISALALALTVLVVFGTRELKKLIDYLTLIALVGMTVAYSFGTCVILNCFFDKSQPEVFTSEVVSKEISSGKTTTYYLVLNPWGPRTKPERVTVTQYEYETTDEGETVEIYLKRGQLGVPWFFVITA